MSTDLPKLIDRIADAGGPITLREPDEWEVDLRGRQGVAMQWMSEGLRPGTSAEALLIHALRLDARARGATGKPGRVSITITNLEAEGGGEQ